MKKFSVIGCALILSVTGLVGMAQTVPAPAAPKDELVQAWIETVQIAAQFANSECQQLDSVKKFNQLRQVTQTKVEGRLPGYTVDWSKFAVVVKPAPVAK
jgi:hypothetical protein